VEDAAMRRVPELDALRGLAAAEVLIFHLYPERVHGGWAGVDLFFVLSGYLITAIILAHAGTDGFLPRFYARRTLRIWPIYYLTILGFAAINPYLSRPQSLAELPYLLTFTKNLPLYWRDTVPSLIRPLDHTWTLSLEEQFYLIWPATVLLVGPRRLVPLCIATALFSPFWREGRYILFWYPHPDRTLVGHCDGFALGGLLAALMAEARRRPRFVRPLRIGLAAAMAAALAYLAWSCATHGTFDYLAPPQPGEHGTRAWLMFAFALLFAGLVGLVASFAGHAALGPLRLRPLVYLGQISYGLYLYHQVIYWLLDGCAIREDQPLPVAAAKLAVCLVAAVLSWELVERPILALKGRFRYAEAPIVAEGPGDHRPRADPAPRRDASRGRDERGDLRLTLTDQKPRQIDPAARRDSIPTSDPQIG
jgi:peptidoglycan/LPS O-acetylase OafA/YrhL